MVLLCNNPEGLDALLDSLAEVQLANVAGWEKMRRQGGRDLRRSIAYREAGELLAKNNLAQLAPVPEKPTVAQTPPPPQGTAT
jgi:hypothetical protein